MCTESTHSFFCRGSVSGIEHQIFISFTWYDGSFIGHGEAAKPASGVSDKVSKVQIAKLDTAGKYVIGADLQIIEKKTGKVVAEWNTSEGNKVFNRFFSEDEPLNVDTDYVLHEVSAPEGYQKADDIVFRLNKYDSSLSIWRYDEKGSLVEDTKSADEAVTDFTLTMTDKPIKVERDKVY